MSAQALEGAPSAFEAALWAFLDPFCAPPAPAAPPEAVLAEPATARLLLDLCLTHVLLRDLFREEAARAAPASGPSDAELVTQAEANVPGAFEALVERYSAMVVGAAYSQLNEIEAARDVAQDAFMEAARTLASLREREKFGNWVYGIARRKAIYVLRRRKLHQAAVSYKQEEEKLKPAPDEPGAPLDRRERQQEVRHALSQLPEIYREILVLKYMDGRSYDEIAKLLNISLAAVDKRLMRAKEMLRESLKGWMGS